MIVVLKPFRFFGDDKLYIYNAGDIVKHSWSDCRQMPLTTDQASGVVWKFVDESTENIRVFGGFLRAKGVFLKKNDGDRGVFPVFGKTLFCGNCLSWGLLRAC